MVTFRAVHISRARDNRIEGWAVQRSEPGGFLVVVSRIYDIERDAESEAVRLNEEAARRTML
jgi:hypothetical protein